MSDAVPPAEDELAAARAQIKELQAQLTALKLAGPPPLSISAPTHLPHVSSDVELDAAAPKNSGETFGDYELGLGLRPQRRALNVVIPMSGLKDGPFTQAGYRFPKPLINVVGRPVLHWVLEALVLEPDDAVWLPVSDDIELAHGVSRHVQRAFPLIKVHLVRLTMETCGWAETIAATIRQMPLEMRARRTLCVDCHTITHGYDILSAFRALPDGVGASFYCTLADLDASDAGTSQRGDADSAHPHTSVHSRRFSYVQLSACGQFITEVREKVAISSHINIGAYGFPSGSALLASAEALVDEMLSRQRSDRLASTAYHASALISSMMAPPAAEATPAAAARGVAAVPFHALRVHESQFATVGSPEELLEFIAQVSSVPVQHAAAGAGADVASRPLSPGLVAAGGAGARRASSTHLHLLNSRRLRFCFDLDSTLLYWDSGAHEMVPFADNVELVCALHAAGHYIILQTAAAMEPQPHAPARSAGNVGRAVARAGPRVFDALKKHGIPFDELHFGKPAADFYIDSITLNAGAGTLAKDIGWRTEQDVRTIEGGIRARSFNQIALVGDKHIIKSSNRKQIAGEAYYYSHIPAQLAHLFPELVEVVDRPEMDTTSIVQTRVHGCTFSHMLINLTLTVGRLSLLLDALHALHSMPAGSAPAEAQATPFELCANYGRKVGARFNKHRPLYESFAARGMRPDAAAAAILDFLSGYEGAQRCNHAWFIHGACSACPRAERARTLGRCRRLRAGSALALDGGFLASVGLRRPTPWRLRHPRALLL